MKAHQTRLLGRELWFQMLGRATFLLYERKNVATALAF